MRPGHEAPPSPPRREQCVRRSIIIPRPRKADVLNAPRLRLGIYTQPRPLFLVDQEEEEEEELVSLSDWTGWSN